MLKTAYQIGVETALKEAGFSRWLLNPAKAWRAAKATRGVPSRAGLGEGLRTLTAPSRTTSRAGLGEALGAAPTLPTRTRSGLGEGLGAMTAPGGAPAAVAKGGAGAAPAAAPGAAKPIPRWAKMLGLGGVGGGAYYAGTKAAPAAATGGFFGLEPDQGLQQLSPELIRLLLQGQGQAPSQYY